MVLELGLDAWSLLYPIQTLVYADQAFRQQLGVAFDVLQQDFEVFLLHEFLWASAGPGRRRANSSDAGIRGMGLLELILGL